MAKTPPITAFGEFHVVVLKGEGFLYRVGANTYQTFKGKNIPPNAEIVADDSFAKLKKKLYGIISASTINGSYADIYVWMDRGLYITCAAGFLEERRGDGTYNIATGLPMEVD